MNVETAAHVMMKDLASAADVTSVFISADPCIACAGAEPCPVLSYLKEFLRPSWLKSFFFAKTAPLENPPYFHTRLPADYRKQYELSLPAR